VHEIRSELFPAGAELYSVQAESGPAQPQSVTQPTDILTPAPAIKVQTPGKT